MANIKKTTPPKSDSAYVYENLRADIILGRIKPYEHIVERNYAAKLGVSRTPVRGELRLLERDGLVVFHPKRGVQQPVLWYRKNVEEVFELRSICIRNIQPCAVAVSCTNQRVICPFFNNNIAKFV